MYLYAAPTGSSSPPPFNGASPEGSSKGPREAASHSVFIVEDHAIVREGYAGLFEQAEGLDVAGMAATAEEALEAIPAASPDLIVVDVSLPGMSGIDLVALLKERDPSVRALVVSGQEQQVYEARALEAGALRFVAKYDGPAVLLQAVREALGQGPSA